MAGRSIGMHGCSVMAGWKRGTSQTSIDVRAVNDALMISRTTGQCAGPLGARTRQGAYNFCVTTLLMNCTTEHEQMQPVLLLCADQANCWSLSLLSGRIGQDAQTDILYSPICNATSEYSPISDIGLTLIIIFTELPKCFTGTSTYYAANSHVKLQIE